MGEKMEARGMVTGENRPAWSLINSIQAQVDEEKGKNCADGAEAIKKIQEYMKNHSETGQYEYLVRGATLVCSNGSHKRKVNLPKCHGVYAGVHPLLHELECVPEENIPSFGVCSAASGQPSQPETVTYKLTEKNSKTGKAGLITGCKCNPAIIGQWNDTYTRTRIVDNGDKLPADRESARRGGSSCRGQCTVTTGSFLVCKYGGLITPVDSGQNTQVTINDFYSPGDYVKVLENKEADRKHPTEKK